MSTTFTVITFTSHLRSSTNYNTINTQNRQENTDGNVLLHTVDGHEYLKNR